MDESIVSNLKMAGTGSSNHVEKIKKFNRFYTNMIGIYTQYTDGSPYSMSEAMIMFEIDQMDKCTATHLSEYFSFDKGYVSRIINKLIKEKVIERVSADFDRRIKYLHITERGKKELKILADRASENVRRMIEDIDNTEMETLIQSMEKIEEILSKNHS
ncbi:MarR family winged helix-turn-helix transcriptional regulator [Virgibacillus sp. YIM 98842]|uniref:MarR family winged helix-turn-helix transcriptional regulator n=1 Tax=Virgibacillus sp. YIM 98842 TaxID=2663533 RepID=UPI0013DC8E51|nr:MarR family winged helix-turn-helix transcriptional regulator [Virgibacillus sp. YIM 98842]